MDTKDGGAAFPRTASTGMGADWWTAPAFKGMSLRDYFAAAALPVASTQLERAIAAGGTFTSSVEELLAYTAYEMADAMLKAREQTPSP